MTNACPYCGGVERQVKAGLHGDRQRYKCSLCQRRYLETAPPETLPRQRGVYGAAVRTQAALLQSQGLSLRAIARQLNVNHQTAANWLRTNTLTSAFSEADSQTAEASETASASSQEELPASTPAAKRRPTITDVAERAGVSTASVSNYLNQKGRMAQETRQRIQQAMDALNFTPSALVRAIRKQRTNILGVVLYGLDRLDEREEFSITTGLLRGIHDAANEANYDLLLYTGWPKHRQQEPGIRFLDGHIDGLVWVNPGMAARSTPYPPLLTRVAASLPVVTLLTRHVPQGVGYVNADNLGAMRMLVAHLVARGHRRIAYAGRGRLSNAMDRHEGYRLGLEENGITYDSTLQVLGEKRKTAVESADAALSAWLALPSPPSAIICHNDLMAATFARAIQARGLHIPNDIALTGFDDMPLAEHIAGGLTTLRQPFRRMGRLAVESVLKIIEGGSGSDFHLTVPTELVVRASTAEKPMNT